MAEKHGQADYHGLILYLIALFGVIVDKYSAQWRRSQASFYVDRLVDRWMDGWIDN